MLPVGSDMAEVAERSPIQPASLLLGHGSPMTLPPHVVAAVVAAGIGAEDDERRVHASTIPRRASATRSTSSSAMPG